MLSPATSKRCGFVGEVSCVTLSCGNIGTAGLSPGVLFSEPGALLKRLRCPAQRPCQAIGGLPDAMRCALCGALAPGGLALVGGLLSEILLFLASSPLLQPTEALALSRGALISHLLSPISRALALVRYVVTVIGRALSLIRKLVALVGNPVALIRGPLTLVRQPVALIGHPLDFRQPSRLMSAPMLTTQPVPLALQGRIIGREPRFSARTL